MADFAYDQYTLIGEEKVYAQPPPELLTAFDCERFHVLPRAGGLEDQPMLLIHRMKIALNTYENVKAFRQAQNLPADASARWYSANPKIVKFVEYVWRLQGAFNDR